MTRGIQFTAENPDSDSSLALPACAEKPKLAKLSGSIYKRQVLAPNYSRGSSNIAGDRLCFLSKLPYDVTPEQALSHEEVKTRLDNSIRNMRAVTDKFLSAIISSVDKIP